MNRMALKDCCAFDHSKQLDAASLQELIDDTGDICLLPSSKDYDWKTTRLKAGSLICHGPIITMGKARYANIKFCAAEYVSSNNMLIKPRDHKVLDCRYLFDFLKRYSAKARIHLRGWSECLEAALYDLRLPLREARDGNRPEGCALHRDRRLFRHGADRLFRVRECRREPPV